MRNLDRIASSFFNSPLMLNQSKAEIISDVLIRALQSRDLTAFEDQKPAASGFIGTSIRNARGFELYRRTADGVAIVTIDGSLTNRGSWIGASSGVVGYEGLVQQLRSATADPEVRSILLDINSPGGTVAGAFEAAAAIREIDRQKPVYSIANSLMASAAYLLASSTRRIFAPSTAMVGSIGVIVSLFDRSEQLAKEGIRPVFVRSVSDKATPNGVEPITSEQTERLQQQVDQLHRMFASTVATARPQLSVEAIAQLKGRVLLADDALKAGLIDQIADFEATVRAIGAGTLNRFEQRKGISRMIEETETPATARVSERKRIAGIFQHAGAAEFPTLASLMIDADFSVETASRLFEAASADAEGARAAAVEQAAVQARAESAAEIEQLKADQATRAAAVSALAAHDPKISDEDASDAPVASIADFMKNKFAKKG